MLTRKINDAIAARAMEFVASEIEAGCTIPYKYVPVGMPLDGIKIPAKDMDSALQVFARCVEVIVVEYMPECEPG